MEQISYNIVAELYKENSHVRALSKKLEINHMSIKRKIEELERENIVDYRKEGKNKVYFLKKSIETEEFLKITEHYKLIKIIKKHPFLRKVVEKIKYFNIGFALIFGSYAKGLEDEGSDIDIYIETKNRKIKKDLELINSKLSIKIGKFDKSNLLAKEIIKNHIILKGVEKYYESIY